MISRLNSGSLTLFALTSVACCVSRVCVAMTRPKFRLFKETFIKPSGKEHTDDEVPLNGFDVLIGHMNVRLVYYFEALLPVEALKASLAEALVSFPLFSGRSKQAGSRHFIELNGAGALVREQRVTFYGQDGALDSPALRPYLDGFAGPERRGSAHRGHMLTITFTEVCHAEGLSCAPPTACRGGQEAAVAEDWSGKRPIKYALGVSASHGVADGSSIASFLLNWAMVSCGGTRLPLAPFHRSLIPVPRTNTEAGEENKAEEPVPQDFVEVGLMGRVSLVASALWSEYACTNCSLYFSAAELENIKARCMAPLQGTNLWVTTSNSLAAHCWPIVSAIIDGLKPSDLDGQNPDNARPLCPLLVVFNCRRHLGLPPTFFGNCASFEMVDTSTAHEDVSALALKVRKTSSQGDGDRIRSEYQYVQERYENGNLHSVMHRAMRDGIMGKPFMGWDDVSSFQPPPSMSSSGRSRGGVAFGGVQPLVIDFHPGMWFPGMAFVLPAPHGNETGGKEVVLCLRRSQARRLLRPEWQARLHQYRPTTEVEDPHARADSITRPRGEREDARPVPPVAPTAGETVAAAPEPPVGPAEGGGADKPEPVVTATRVAEGEKAQ